MAYIEVKVKEITADPESDGCFRLVLEDTEGGLVLPMVISALDARPLAAELEGDGSARPQAHDLIQALAEATGWRIERFDIGDFRRGVFYGALRLCRDSEDAGDNSGERIELDCRPSDGITLCLRYGAPVRVDEAVMRRVGGLLSRNMDSMKVSQRIRIMEEKLERLVGEERYEEAGILRDQIKRLKMEQAK